MEIAYYINKGGSLQVINLIQRQVEVNTEVGVLIADVNKLQSYLDGSKASFVRRCGNSVAHLMAKNAVRDSGVHT